MIAYDPNIIWLINVPYRNGSPEEKELKKV